MSSPVLTAARLFEPVLPAAWAPILDALADLEDLSHETGDDSEQCKVKARAIHARLMDDAAILAEPTPETLALSSAPFRLWFTESVLLWIRLAATSSAPLVNTLGARSLLDFPLDLPEVSAAGVSGSTPDPDGRRPTGAERIRAALREAFGWAEQDFNAVERTIDHLTSNLFLKRKITRALMGLLAKGDGLSPHGRAELMRSFYGSVPWRPGDVDLVVTSTAIFFCIPAAPHENRLDIPAFDDRPAQEREAIATFLRLLDAANVAETTRFPAFGFFDRTALDPALVRALAEAVACPAQVIEQTLITMVSILRSSQVERYLVHDAWGHTWQEALVELEWEYAILPRLDEPLWLHGGILAPSGAGIASAFTERDGRTALDEAALLRFVEADLRARIQVATSAALSEMLADFMEMKYARLRPGFLLPTSSLLPSTVLKLDLTLGDVRRQVCRWSKPYRTLAEDASARAQLARMLARTLPEPGLRDAVDRAALLCMDTFAPAFGETLRPEPAPGHESAGRSIRSIRSNVLRRIALQFTRLAASLARTVEASGRPADPPWLDPGSCPDLFAVTLARFYEHDHQASFWHLDQLMATELAPACELLAGALQRARIDTRPHNEESGCPMSKAQASPRREELAPLFTDVTMSADDAGAIVAALRDIAETDGVHEEELAMIAGFVELLDADLGAPEPTSLQPMTPAKLALQLVDPTLRTVAVQCAVLLAMADGSISNKERARVTDYASALGVTGDSYAEIERVITEWVKSGDIATIV